MCGRVSRGGSGSVSWGGLVGHWSGSGGVGDGSGLVGGSGLVSIVFGLSFIGDIGDEARVAIDAVNHPLDATVGKGNAVLAVGLVTVSLLLLVELLVIITLTLVVHVIPEVVEGSGVGVVVGAVGGGVVGLCEGRKGQQGDKGLERGGMTSSSVTSQFYKDCLPSCLVAS